MGSQERVLRHKKRAMHDNIGHVPREEEPMWRSTVGLIVILALSVLIAPLTAAAQPPTKIHRIGILWLDSQIAI